MRSFIEALPDGKSASVVKYIAAGSQRIYQLLHDHAFICRIPARERARLVGTRDNFGNLSECCEVTNQLIA
jgi:hypothetical protein